MSKNIYPSNATWITPRSEETQITSDNCVILLPKKIDHLDKVILNCEIIQMNIRVTVEGSGDDVQKQCPLSDLYLDSAGTKKIGNIDLMAYIPEKAEYDTLPVIQGRNIFDNELLQLYKNNTWYYTHEGNTIRLVNDRMGGLIFPAAVTQNLIRGVLLRIMQTAEPNLDGKRTFYYKDENGDMWQVTPPGAFSFYYELFPQTIQFRVEYTPLAESVKLQTAKTAPQKNEFQMPFSQKVDACPYLCGGSIVLPLRSARLAKVLLCRHRIRQFKLHCNPKTQYVLRFCARCEKQRNKKRAFRPCGKPFFISARFTNGNDKCEPQVCFPVTAKAAKQKNAHVL